MKLVALALGVLLSACQGDFELKNPYTYKKAEPTYFEPYVNAKDKETASLVNPAYPITIQLYDNQTFRYELDVLGEGKGEWAFEDGYLRLYAERDLFVMNMFLHQADGLTEPVLEFRDRFGPNFLEMERK
ncbi:hypothetical protein [Pseudobacteriovorax antillogorgiicola]|uniref:Uncharacterized protein n=1 Tax=Pseudobacteriovorax antillogorgiicola TaxID=1513793 RepID=A0A1Y6BFA5_9BACT|nr:hypothetical protein [Pseudobacteriovorax antillogorgiicola]TCS56233.1 hypothetical protein EDD56_10455 [Pseudobacteriovorax antillogorgiicola]SMF08231.1 hypothetical protein SAMN06296036_104278 [Pseudobacteriovorax antillogorgiicola]